jgi:hypothetical protein
MFRSKGLTTTVVIALAILAVAGLASARLNAQRGDNGAQQSPTPPGLYIPPTALPDAIQQLLNPGLANYLNFVAGEAVKAAAARMAIRWRS